jgi:alkanesulfonate monooxygenase SsuD/methylene tetrahydromethanopterin reductase-like flavin-dependent oxidoreductase (luciferase family)
MDFGCFLPGHWFNVDQPLEEMYDDLLTEAALAEKCGFSHIWLAEHHFNNYIAQPAPMQLAAMLADRTTTVKIGIAVVVLPFYHPLRLAGELAQLDVLLKGRLVATLGRGAFRFEAYAMGQDMTDEENRELCSESIQILAATLRSRMRAVDHKGKRWQFENVTIIPPSYSKTSPDLWVAAQSPLSAEWAVKLCVESGLRPQIFCSQLRRPFSVISDVHSAYKKALASYGKGLEDGTFAVNQVVYVADSVDQARSDAFGTVYPLNRGVYNLIAVAGAARDHVRDGVVTETPLVDEPSEDELLAGTVIGDTEFVIEHLRPYAELGVDHLSLHTNIGLPHELVSKSLTLFSQGVMPHLANVGIRE